MLAWFVLERRPAKNRHRYDGHSFLPTLENFKHNKCTFIYHSISISIYFRAQASGSTTAREQEMVDQAIKASKEDQARIAEAEQERLNQGIKASLEPPP